MKKLAREPSNAMLTRGKAKAEAHNQVEYGIIRNLLFLINRMLSAFLLWITF